MISEAATPLRTVIADNDPLVRRLAATVLGELGFETRVAADGADAWRMIEEARPHLVVIDAETPIVDGVEVCRRIRELDSGGEVFVMFLAGRDCPAALQSLLDAGGDDFVVKPITADVLRARLMVTRRRIGQEAARRAAEAEISRNRWLSGIGEATLSLQHEINNPLTALLGSAELMRMDLRDRGQANELLEVIHEQALRIAAVVRRLRRLKNPESVDFVGGSRLIDLWTEHATG